MVSAAGGVVVRVAIIVVLAVSDAKYFEFPNGCAPEHSCGPDRGREEHGLTRNQLPSVNDHG
jgi:hypothetical protein